MTRSDEQDARRNAQFIWAELLALREDIVNAKREMKADVAETNAIFDRIDDHLRDTSRILVGLAAS